ncbi:MAG: histidine phosphatase family protein, partial [Chloroflexota bacterium]
MLDGVVHIVRRHLHGQLDPVLGQLFDGRLHQVIRAKRVVSGLPMRLVILSRHGESTLNVERRVNGDPERPGPLTETGRDAARRLGAQLAGIPVDLCVHTRFERTRETAELALLDRGIPMEIEPLFDDIDVGDLDGEPVDAYRAWKEVHTRQDAFPGGESLDDAARRYARAFRKLLTLEARAMLVVCHEIPLRYALNAAGGSDDLELQLVILWFWVSL